MSICLHFYSRDRVKAAKQLGPVGCSSLFSLAFSGVMFAVGLNVCLASSALSYEPHNEILSVYTLSGHVFKRKEWSSQEFRKLLPFVFQFKREHWQHLYFFC